MTMTPQSVPAVAPARRSAGAARESTPVALRGDRAPIDLARGEVAPVALPATRGARRDPRCHRGPGRLRLVAPGAGRRHLAHP